MRRGRRRPGQRRHLLLGAARAARRAGSSSAGWTEVLDLLHAGGIRVDLATATASPPPWLTRAHPEIAAGARRRHRALARRPAGLLPQLAGLPRALAARWCEALAERYARPPGAGACGTSATSSAATTRAATATSAPRRSATGCASATATSTGSTTPGAPRSGASATATGTRSCRRAPRRPSPTRPSSSTSSGSPPTSCSANFGPSATCCAGSRPAVPVTTNFMVACVSTRHGLLAPGRAEVDVVSNDHYLTVADPDGHRRAGVRRRPHPRPRRRASRGC